MIDISLVIPLYNEEESLPELTQWIERVMTKSNFSYELIFIDDGSDDNSWAVIENLQASNPNIRATKFQRNYGKSAGLHVGFQQTKGDVVITMDADLQDNPDEIPVLYKMITEEDYDIVSGWKRNRKDPLEKRIPSKLYNGTVRLFSGIQLHDFNCGLKAYKKKVVKSIEVFGEMHRYIPVIAKRAGFKKITEKEVHHLPRKYGYSKFGIERYFNGFLDLLTITFISKFGKKPMHFFGFVGALCFFLGLSSMTYLTIQKFCFDVPNIDDRPLFHIGILAITIGSQFFLAGFLAEMISRNSAFRNHYQIEKKIGHYDEHHS